MFPILAVFATCILRMIKTSSKKRVKLPILERETRETEIAIWEADESEVAEVVTGRSRKRMKLPIWERENGKQDMEIWLTGFLAKLKRNSTRTQKCRLILSVERMNFEDNLNAAAWQYVGFGEKEAEIFRKDKRSLDEKLKLTEFQKIILKSDPSLKNQFLGRSELKPETGKWEISADLEKRKISEGGEAILFCDDFGDSEAVVRVHIFDPQLFAKDFGLDSLSWKIHLEKDFEKATDKSGNQNQIPKHENVIKNFVNIELFHIKDAEYEDCVGWITIMEKAGEDLRTILKEEKIGIDERKKIAQGIGNGFNYLDAIRILHFDRKLENILVMDGIPKIIDFGLVREETGRSGYREMGYARKGSKFRNEPALLAATPGFADQRQITNGRGYNLDNLWYYLFCNWKTAATLLYKPIDEKERKMIDEIVKKCSASSIHKIKNGDPAFFSEITSIIEIPSSSAVFCLDDRNLTKSVNVSYLKQNATKFLNQDLQNVTKNVLDQKSSNLCVPISVATLLRFAMKNDLHFKDNSGRYSAEKILASLTLIVYPRSMAGLNLNPKKEEEKNQLNEIELLLKRVCEKTYLMETGWHIIRKIDIWSYSYPQKSTCKFEQVILNENFHFNRPLTVTGAFLLPDRVVDGTYYPEEVFFHQMVLDRIDNPTDCIKAEYVIHNTSFAEGGPVLKIPKTRAYYVDEFVMRANRTAPGEYKYYGQNGDFMWLVNERFGNTMQPNTWYLLPQAYSITLVPCCNSTTKYCDCEP